MKYDKEKAVPEKHILFCGRCFRVTNAIIGLPPETRSFALPASDYSHFINRMCIGVPVYKGIALLKEPRLVGTNGPVMRQPKKQTHGMNPCIPISTVI